VADLKTLGSMEFIYLAEVSGREWKLARLYLACDWCKTNKGRCLECGGAGYAVVSMPVLIQQQMPPEDFEKLREAMRRADG
jgi:hypothetical protein